MAAGHRVLAVSALSRFTEEHHVHKATRIPARHRGIGSKIPPEHRTRPSRWTRRGALGMDGLLFRLVEKLWNSKEVAACYMAFSRNVKAGTRNDIYIFAPPGHRTKTLFYRLLLWNHVRADVLGPN